RAFIVAPENQLRERGRAGDVGPLADVHEVRVWAYRERLQPAQAGVRLRRGTPAWREIAHRIRDGADMRRRRPAAATDDIEPPAGRKLPKIRRHNVRRLIESSKRVRQAGVGIATAVD